MRPSALAALILAVLAGLGCSSGEPEKAERSAASAGGAGSGASGGAAGSGGSASGTAGSGGAGNQGGASAGGSAGSTDGGSAIGAAEFADGELDAASHGATITLQEIGAAGEYPSRRDPASGECDAYQSGECCMTQHDLTSAELTPWNEELIMTLRGPMLVKQLVVYQPVAADSGDWQVVSAWDDRDADAHDGLDWAGNETESLGFSGVIGSECLVDFMTDEAFPCGPGSVPYCPTPGAGDVKRYGWQGSKLFVVLASMPHASSAVYEGTHCSNTTDGNWYDAPWIGLSHGELVRSGKFGDCHCYGNTPPEWAAGEGCGQFNVFEVVNDNNQYANLDLFSTNLFAYHGYVGEGPCGENCDVSGLSPSVDLVDKSNSQEAAEGAICTPDMGPGAAFRRPAAGYRYFVILLDVGSRTIQLGIVHPENVPDQAAALLPELPLSVPRSAIDSLLALRLPQ